MQQMTTEDLTHYILEMALFYKRWKGLWLIIGFPNKSWASRFHSTINSNSYHKLRKTEPSCNDYEVTLFLRDTVQLNYVKTTTINERIHLLFAFKDERSATAWCDNSKLWRILPTGHGRILSIPVEWTEDMFRMMMGEDGGAQAAAGPSEREQAVIKRARTSAPGGRTFVANVRQYFHDMNHKG